MGNRAVITPSTNDNAPSIYLHWNGGLASVEAFLAAARHLSIRGSDAANFDRIAELIATHFFKCEVGMTVYRQSYGRADSDNWDNGTYLVDENLNIVDRLYQRNGEEFNPKKPREIFEHITQRAPVFNG